MNLVRRFGHFIAVDGVTFDCPGPSLVALLGPNGAGKSTTMRLLTGFLAPTSGRASICGHDVTTDAGRLAAAGVLGYLPENGPLHPEMTPTEVLSFAGEARGLGGKHLDERIDAVVTMAQLGDVLGRPCGKLSKGYRQRVGLAAALLHDPKVLILDEPTAGLDPNQVEHVRALLTDLAATRLIVLSTHILSEVRAMAKRIVLINHGKVILDGQGNALGANERDMEDRFRTLTAA